MLLKITTGSFTGKHNFADDCTLQELQKFIEDKTGIADVEMEILVGFPPTLLQHHSFLPEAPLSSIGIANGMLITVRVNAALRDLFRQLSAMGFPRSSIKRCLQIVSLPDIDTCVEICSQLGQESKGEEKEDGKKPEDETARPLVRKSIPADNSCLFNAIGFIVEQPAPVDPFMYREMIASYISAHQDDYPPDFLDGKSIEEYKAWITNSSKWGGEIEISIFTVLLGIQINVVDIRTGNLYFYGEDQHFPKQAFLLYDGVHYDALMRPSRGGAVCTLFDVNDAHAKDSAQQIGKELQSQKKFVNLAQGQFLCGECYAVLSGERAAVEHAKATGHTNFSQSE